MMLRITLTMLLLATMARPALAGTAFDGTYAGPWHATVSNNTGACTRGEQANAHITVQNNQFSIRWVGQPVPVTIADDGTIKGDTYIQERALSLHVVVSGKATAAGLEADAGTASCAYKITMKKQ